MKDQPLPLNSAVDLWPWVHFSLGFLTSFGRLSFKLGEYNLLPGILALRFTNCEKFNFGRSYLLS